MFSGIIEASGVIKGISSTSDGIRVNIASEYINPELLRPGDSIAVSGVCLTIVECMAGEFDADVSNETVFCTNFASYRAGTLVNLEKPVTMETALNGHIVSGHVDATARCISCESDGTSIRLVFEVSKEVGRLLAVKGSVALDGISLTVNEVSDAGDCTHFSVNVIPYTQQVTTLGKINAGDNVHVEVDMLARYVDRLLSSMQQV